MKSKQIKKLLSLSVLSVGVLASSVMTAFATGEGSPTVSAPRNFNSSLDIEIKATTVDVTVPGNAPVVFNEGGTVTTPLTWPVKNNSLIAGVHITKLTVDGTEKKWKVVSGDTDLKTMPVNDKKIRLKFGKKGGELKLVAPVSGSKENVRGQCDFGNEEIVIPANETQEFSFEIERGAFTTPTENSAKAFDMVLTFAFN